jgi:hypothetical protein
LVIHGLVFHDLVFHRVAPFEQALVHPSLKLLNCPICRRCRNQPMGGPRAGLLPPGQNVGVPRPSWLGPTNPMLARAARVPSGGAQSGKAVAAQPGMTQAAPHGQSGCGRAGAPRSEAAPPAEQMAPEPISPLAAGGRMAARTGSRILRATA